MLKLYVIVQLLELLALSAGETKFVDTVSTAFIAEALRQIQDDNALISPILLSDSLTLLLPGATDTTAWEIRQLIPASIVQWMSHPTPQGVNIGSRLYVAKDINILPAYQQKIQNAFNNSAESVDFADTQNTLSKINQLIAQRTSSKLTASPDSNTKILLVGGISFNGQWKQQFNDQNTLKSPFHIPQKDGGIRTVKVETMVQTGSFQISYIPKLDADSLKLPYKDSKLEMVILLPKNVDGVENLLEHLDEIETTNISPSSEEEIVQIFLPKFKFNLETDLKSIVQALGLKELFEDAHLPYLTDRKNDKLFVNEILHIAEIEVNEEGSSAVTGNDNAPNDFRTPNKIFNIDHPFLFLIKDEHTIYGAGRVGRLE